MCELSWVTRLCFVVLMSIALSVTSCLARADALLDAMQLWRKYAPYCESEVTRFPSTRSLEDGEGPKGSCRIRSCGDGDATLIPNGMLCLVGETDGCEGVRRSQDSTGKWHRSPRLANRPECRIDDEFSPDMGLGVQSYLLTASNISAQRPIAKQAGQRWWNWLSGHSDCQLEVSGQCLLPRVLFCEHPSGGPGPERDWRCAFRPFPIGGDFATLAETERNLDLKAERFFRGPLGSDAGKATIATLMAAKVNDAGFPQHLTATQILLLRKLGREDGNLDEAAKTLAEKQPENPFFAYLHEGATAHVRDLTLRYCPTIEMDIKRHMGLMSNDSIAKESAWWESCKADKEDEYGRGPNGWFLQHDFHLDPKRPNYRPWCHSTLWDCIFLGRLLGVP